MGYHCMQITVNKNFLSERLMGMFTLPSETNEVDLKLETNN